ncbi:MAG: SPOR domain-containing protein, partial [Bacteroidales bacterium]|nr:SPOR domain-containing protein [Bacteroidales bacterium]
LQPIYSKLEEKYSSHTEFVEVSGTESNGTEILSNANTDNTGKTTASSQLKASVVLQNRYETNIATADTEISDIETNLATADRSEKKRLQTELNEVTTERNDNVRSLGGEKERFYAEIDKVAREQISSAEASAEYSNRYADYRQSLYSLTNAEQQGGNVTEKLSESEKSEYALLQTIIPHVDNETKSVLQPIYSKLEEKYSSHTEPINVSGTEVLSNANTDNAGKTTASSQLKASVALQNHYETNIATADTEISDIETNLATADRSEKKRLQTELNEVTTERNDNVRSLGGEKERFYAEIDKVAREQISNEDASVEYSNRYADYRQSLYSLTNAEQQGGNVTEKLAETEKSEYALLQTIIPHVDNETKSVLQPIYSKLDEKYGTGSSVIVDAAYSQSINLQEQMIRNIDISTREIERLEHRKDGAKKSEQRRIADDIAREESQKVDDIQKLAIEKSKFYTEINQSLETVLPKMSDSIRQEYANAYGSYNETLTTMKIGLGFYEMDKANKIYGNAEVQEYKLLQQMKQVATGDVKKVVDDMIVRMETKNSSLTKYRVVINYLVEEVADNNVQAGEHSVEKTDATINNVSANEPDSTKVVAIVDNSSSSSSVTPSRKSMSGYNADSYGIYNMPEINMGLYYRIQIVAVSVRYRMRDFNGLSLIFTELIPNTNIVRYMTGEYYKYVSAREDLPKVRSLGFSDAFIVAYYNGKRISIAEARRLEALQNVEENEEIPVVIRHEAPADYVEPEDVIANVSSKSENVVSEGFISSVENNTINVHGTTNNVGGETSGTTYETHEIPSKGVYFAVQVGVYKDRRQPWQLKGVSPIDYEIMPNGFVRHTSGCFAEYEQARASQMNIRRQGITDAFVIAYIDGRKVSFAEGVEYQRQMASRLVAQSSDNAEMQSKSNGGREENLSNVEYAPLNLTTGTEENNASGISYYVQIGAFSKLPDPEILSVFSKVAGDKIHVKFPREGLQIYRIGVFNSYEEAQNTLAEARSFGIVDAFIVAFKGEEQISSSEAIRLQNAVRQIEGNSGETINNGSVQKSSSQNVSTTSSTTTRPVVPAETLQQSAGGVEYFVQLGAFVNTPDARSMATFRSIASTSGSRLSTVQNGRFTNYRVGAFKTFADVKTAVDRARSMGVTDAFVVAFYNGERIPVAEAKEKE